LARFKIRPNAEPVFTSEPLYDLTEGGYIDPYEVLVDKDADKVAEAVQVIQDFFETLEEHGLIEYS